MAFKQDFLWGAATSSFQIEGSSQKDGKGKSIWDITETNHSYTKFGQTAKTACDHYNRWKSDVAIMKKLGLKSYRFSIAWTRILPDGIGKVNEQGIQFYNNLIDDLVSQQIEPCVTLFHWDFPYELYKKGGWLNDECVNWFSYYAKIVAERFSDRVKIFIPMNEFQCFVWYGHKLGFQAPFLQLPFEQVLEISHNVLKANGQATLTLREYARQPLIIGVAPVGDVKIPFGDGDDVYAKRAMFEYTDDNIFCNSWFMDAIVFGHYPADYLKAFGTKFKFTNNDMKLINQPIDFQGLNIYNGEIISHNDKGEIVKVLPNDNTNFNSFDWTITPDALYYGAKFHYERYHLPIMITENGVCLAEMPSQSGQLNDQTRISFLQKYLQGLKKANDEGVEVIGYFVWSLLDNFEWAEGFSKRFGLVYVDFDTQQRIIKDSGYWYKNIIATNGDTL